MGDGEIIIGVYKCILVNYLYSKLKISNDGDVGSSNGFFVFA